jgi:hypothetical protein
MFNLLVTADSAGWETDNTMQMLRERFKECSGSEAASISLRDPDSLNLLETVPTLLMYESASDDLGIVRYGSMTGIKVVGSRIKFNFDTQGFFRTELIEEFGNRLGIDSWEYNRTHWAIKNGEIPRELMSRMTKGPYKSFRYDIVLSFAGENRTYVEGVAGFLRKQGVAVFYDRHEEAELWGKELSEELDMIYSEEGRYCVMFVSRHYAEKMWTTHERRSAIERALKQRSEYILPVRFDDTEVPGLRSTVGYIDANKKTPHELGKLILQKLGRKA